MATEAMRKMSEEYLTAAAGPTSHSPPPIEVAAITAPGPITFSRFRPLNGSGAGRSSTLQRGNAPWSAGSASAAALDPEVVIAVLLLHEGPFHTPVSTWGRSTASVVAHRHRQRERELRSA